MNLLKINMEYAKRILDKENFAYQVFDGKVLLADGNMFYLLDKKDCVLNLDEDFLNRKPVNLKCLLDEESASVPATLSDIRELVACGKKKKPLAKVYANDGDCECWIDERYLKNFEKDATFAMGAGKKYPTVFVYEWGKLAGGILPVNRGA